MWCKSGNTLSAVCGRDLKIQINFVQSNLFFFAKYEYKQMKNPAPKIESKQAFHQQSNFQK